MHSIELKSGQVLEATILAKALCVMVVKDKEGKFFLVSKYALKDPKSFKFYEVVDEPLDASRIE